jgi:lipoprotein-anchoring transpeptidase ErfK/SrfK
LTGVVAADTFAPPIDRRNKSFVMDTFWIESNRRRGMRHWARLALLWLVVLVLITSAGVAVAAYRAERQRSALILPGVVIQGVPVGGMKRDAAIRAVTGAVDPDLYRQVTVEAGGETWMASARALGLRADVASAVDAALAHTRERSTLSRLLGRLQGRTDPLLIRVTFSLDELVAGRFLAQVARTVAVAPRDARLVVRGGKVVGVGSRIGAALVTERSRQIFRRSLLGGSTVSFPGRVQRVALVVREIAPKVSTGSLGRTIAVDVTSNHLSLYEGLHVIRKYPVATAMPGFVTPPGKWTVVRKAMFPTWYNPAPNGWGANEPLVVPPGPDNPMGTRALYLDAPGLIRIHGTNTPSSIGHYASHGCIRLFIPNIEELYDLVSVGTKVLIYGAPPWGVSKASGISGA